MRAGLKHKIVILIGDALKEGLTAEECEELYLASPRRLRLEVAEIPTRPFVTFLKKRRRA
jgi:hypothetical protein